MYWQRACECGYCTQNYSLGLPKATPIDCGCQFFKRVAERSSVPLNQRRPYQRRLMPRVRTSFFTEERSRAARCARQLRRSESQNAEPCIYNRSASAAAECASRSVRGESEGGATGGAPWTPAKAAAGFAFYDWRYAKQLTSPIQALYGRACHDRTRPPFAP